jgi:hypothetical protein
MSDFNLKFQQAAQAYSVIFSEQDKATSETVLVDGKHYKVEGEPEKVAWLREKLGLSSETNISKDSLSDRILSLDVTNLDISECVDIIGVSILGTSAAVSPDSTSEVKRAYLELKEGLEKYAKEELEAGALLVKVVGVPEAEHALSFGNLSVDSMTKVSEHTIGRTGSGAKLWGAMLAKILENKYGQYIQLDDGLGKFAPKEMLKKFGKKELNGTSAVRPDLAGEISVRGILGMMAGLEYEIKGIKDTEGKAMDEIMRGDDIADGEIQMLQDPRDRIAFYTNNIALVAYPIEKAYKKVLTDGLFENKSIIVGSTPRGGSLPEDIQQLTLKDLLESDEAYLKDAYVYDLLDMFLETLDPPMDKFTYAQIMQREFLGPMDMKHSGFYGTEGEEMNVTYKDSDTGLEKSDPPPHESVLLQGGGAGRTTLSDAAKLARGLADSSGLVTEDGKLLLDADGLNEIFNSPGHYEAWGLGGSELFCGGALVDKGGSYNQDQYSFWIDRESGVGLIAMCNCGRRPDEMLSRFQDQVKKNYHSDSIETVKERALPIEMSTEEYVAHPLVDPKEYYEGSRGKVALLFNYEEDSEGIMHWSGTPLNVRKKENGKFAITTPGRFEGVEVWKLKGAHTGKDFLAIGDTSFAKTTLDRIPDIEQVSFAKSQFKQFAGDYINPDEPKWGIFNFEIKGEGDDAMLCACWAPDTSKVKDTVTVPLGIVKVEDNAISFNGHDRQPPDKIFRFVRDAEKGPWRLQVTDVASPGMVIETRYKS